MHALGLLLLISWINTRDVNPREERRTRLAAEIEATGAKHPWAGSYYAGDGLGFNGSLLIAPSGEYSFENWGCMGLYGKDDGSIRISNNVLRFERAKSYPLAGKDFNIVPWGERVYLIAGDDLIRFANHVNVGWEPRYDSHGSEFMRRGASLQIASGHPRLPKDIRPYLLDRVVDGTVVAAGPSVAFTTESWRAGELETVVELNIGSNDGMLPGMELQLRDGISGDATIRSARKRDSTAVLTSTIPPRAGWRVSTRYDSRREFAPTDRPFRIKVKKTPGVHYKPYAGRVGLFTDGWNSPDAKKYGFTVNEIARMDIAAVDYFLLDYKILEPMIEAALKPLGANAYERPLSTYRSKVPGPWSQSTVIVGYRVEFDGRPIDTSDLWNDYADPVSWRRTDWARSRASILLKENKYYQAERRARDAFYREQLHLSRKQADAWGTLKIQDLNAEQTAALRENLGMRDVKSGFVHEAIPSISPSTWSVRMELEVWNALRPLRDAEPGLYPDYRRLADQAYGVKH